MTTHERDAAAGDEPAASPRRREEAHSVAAACDCTPVGIPEIAMRLNVERATVDMWRFRGLLPAPRWTVGGRPCWSWPDVEAWARETGRLAS